MPELRAAGTEQVSNPFAGFQDTTSPAYVPPIGPVPQGPQGAKALVKEQQQEKPTYRPQDLKTLGYVAPISAGLGAGNSVVPTTNAAEAVADTVTAGLAGAASGAATGAAIGSIGGAPGALVGAGVGGVVGIVSGGIKSYLGLRAARRARRYQERQNALIQAKNDAREKQSREDAVSNMSYNRRVQAVQSQYNAQVQTMNMINELIGQDQNVKDRFLALGL